MSESKFSPQQLTAIGKRLKYGREHAKITVAKAAEKADLPLNEYKRAEAGKAAMPARNLWFFAVRVHGPVEWLLTGKHTERTVPSPLPKLGLDLTGFSQRLKQTRERLGLSIEDVESAEMHGIPPLCWRDLEAGFDEPQYGYIEEIADAFDVDPAWLYTDTPASGKSKPIKVIKKLSTFNEGLWLPGSCRGAGDRLKQSREAARLSIDEAGRISGLGAKLIRRFESSAFGSKDYCGDPLTVLATLYGVQVDWLNYGDDALEVVKRRLERFKTRLGIDPRKKSKTDVQKNTVNWPLRAIESK
jgi:transcriptional regulator with XRE-family HTH domain